MNTGAESNQSEVQEEKNNEPSDLFQIISWLVLMVGTSAFTWWGTSGNLGIAAAVFFFCLFLSHVVMVAANEICKAIKESTRQKQPPSDSDNN